MSKTGSCRYIIVKLSPLYQQFLRGHFECEDPVFSFPKKHDVLMLLGTLTKKKPKDYVFKAPNWGNDKFMIELPWLDHKHPDVYNYLSDNSITHFASYVRSFYQLHFHERMSKLIKEFGSMREGQMKLNIEMCIDIWIEENGIDPQYKDTIVKEFQRWRKAEGQRKYRRRKRLQKQSI